MLLALSINYMLKGSEPVGRRPMADPLRQRTLRELSFSENSKRGSAIGRRPAGAYFGLRPQMAARAISFGGIMRFTPVARTFGGTLEVAQPLSTAFPLFSPL